MHSDREFDARLEALERELEPTVKTLWQSPAPRPEFARQLQQHLTTDARTAPPLSLPLSRLTRQRAWGALAAVVAGGVLVSAGLFFSRPQPVDAAAVIDQLQTEAVSSVAIAGPGGCGSVAPPNGAAQQRTGAVLYAGSGTGPDKGGPGAGLSGGPGGPNGGPGSISDASELSDKLAAALGVSGDQVRQAMLSTMQSLGPKTPLPDPMAAIAQHLGMSENQVCQAFFSAAPNGAVTIQKGNDGPDKVTTGASGLNLTTATTDQLAPIASKLGVSPQTLQTAVKAAMADITPAQMPAPPPQDQIVSTFAHNLGMDEGRVRTAINQVEGNGNFYFAVPLPGGLGH